MEIWVVTVGDNYEGAYGHDYFFKEKDAVSYAKETHNIREFEKRGLSYYAKIGRHDYLYIAPAEVK